MTNKCWFIFVYMTENFTFDKNQSLLSKLNLKVTEEEKKAFKVVTKNLDLRITIHWSYPITTSCQTFISLARFVFIFIGFLGTYFDLWSLQREFRVDFAQSLTTSGCVIIFNIHFVKKITLSWVNHSKWNCRKTLLGESWRPFGFLHALVFFFIWLYYAF